MKKTKKAKDKKEKTRLFLVGLVIFFAVSLTIAIPTVGVFCQLYNPYLPFYDMHVADLSLKPDNLDAKYDYMFDRIVLNEGKDNAVVNGESLNYIAHPDSVLLDNGEIVTAYVIGHGRGQTVMQVSTDKGLSWSDRIEGLPDSFKHTEETPTLYKLDFTNGDQKLILIQGRPGWGGKGEGFDVSLSVSKGADGKCDGKVWEAHKNYFGPNAEPGYVEKAGVFEPIVAMASLTRLKDENGNFIDKWMGLFHNYEFEIMKTYLTFDSQGNMQWTRPERAIDKAYRHKEKTLNFCEPEVIRSPEGDELAMIVRTNAKISNSQIMFSKDEGKTWSEPEALSRELTGERHKAEYDPLTGKLLITFRAINWKLGQEHRKFAWFSRGWVTWIGDYSDLHKGEAAKGDVVVKMAHTYLDKQTAPETSANADTGYAGFTIDEDGMVVMSSYGRFSPDNDIRLGGNTYIITKRFTVTDLYELFGMGDLLINKT